MRITDYSNQLALALLAALSSITPAHAVVTEWHSSSGQTPDQVAAWSLVDDYPSLNPTFVSGALQLGASSGTLDDRMYYTMTGSDLSFADGPTYWMEGRVRVLNGAHTAGWLRAPAVMAVRFGNGRQMVLQIDPDRYYLLSGDNAVDSTNGLATGVDNASAFHTFRVEIDGTTSGSTVRVYRDGLLALTDNSIYNFGGSTASVWFGEGSILARGQSQWTYVSHNMAAISNVSAVPEPETYALMLAGLGVVGAVGRRKAKAMNTSV